MLVRSVAKLLALSLGLTCLADDPIYFPTAGAAINRIPDGYAEIWSDEFTALSLRSGGPTYLGLEAGKGTWSSPGAWYSENIKGVQGYAYDWFVNPTWGGMPTDYPGAFALTASGVQISSQAPTPMTSVLLPKITQLSSGLGAVLKLRASYTPWLSGQLNSYHAVRFSPPFYFEVQAKMPVGSGRPFPAVWLTTEAHNPTLNTSDPNFGKEYEIDLHEGFGDSDALHATIHWTLSSDTSSMESYNIATVPAGFDLSADFNTWGVWVTADQQILYFNGVEMGRMATPANTNINQPFGIMLDVAAGIPWQGGGPPSGGPHTMTVRYVRLYAPDASGLTLQNP